jgi:hypothetical protein
MLRTTTSLAHTPTRRAGVPPPPQFQTRPSRTLQPPPPPPPPRTHLSEVWKGWVWCEEEGSSGGHARVSGRGTQVSQVKGAEAVASHRNVISTFLLNPPRAPPAMSLCDL